MVFRGLVPKLPYSAGGRTNDRQDKRLLRLSNKAKTLTEMYKHASMVVPITLPRPLGSNIALDYASNWHTSAIITSALETVLLPSRLKDSENRDTLSGITALLNAMGKQSLANLQMRVDRQTTETSLDSRMGEAASDEDDESDGLRLALDFAPSEQLESGRQANGHQKPRIFSQVVTSRGQAVDDDANGNEAAEGEGFQRRNPNKPASRRYVPETWR